MQTQCPKCGKNYEGNLCPNGCNSPHHKSKKKKMPVIGWLVALLVPAIVFITVFIVGSIIVEDTGTIVSSSNSILATESNSSNSSTLVTSKDTPSEKNISKETDNSKIESSMKSSSPQKSSTSKLADKDIGNVLTNTVDLTIPASFFELNDEPFDYKLTEEDKANGFTSIKKNSDGSATYTIKKDKYKIFISKLKKETQLILDELVTEGTYTSFKDIDYNDDFSEITIIVDKELYENSLDSFAVMGCNLTVYLYQIYDIDANQGCIIKIKDAETGEIFETKTYPE